MPIPASDQSQFLSPTANFNVRASLPAPWVSATAAFTLFLLRLPFPAVERLKSSDRIGATSGAGRGSGFRDRRRAVEVGGGGFGVLVECYGGGLKRW